MDLRNKWFIKQLSTQQFSGGHFTAEKRGHFAVEWWGHLRAELVGHYPRILQYTSYNVNGLITGADYDPVHKEVVLVGYFSGHNYSFLWFLSDFQGVMFFSGNKRRIEISSGKEWQTEAVCYISNRRFFVSCETTDSIDASLYVCNENWLNTTFVPQICGNEHITSYPNPVKEYLQIDNASEGGDYTIFDMAGKVVSDGKLQQGSNTIKTVALMSGNYFLEISSNGSERKMIRFVKE